METIWKKKLATVIGSMIPSGLFIKTLNGKEKAVGMQIKETPDFDAVIVTETNATGYNIEDVKPYLRTYFQLTESEKTHLGYLDDDYEKSEISVALAYMMCVTDRDGQNEFVEKGYALKATRGMYEPIDWEAYEKELCDEAYEQLTTLEERSPNFSNDDLDDEEDYDEK